MLLLPSVTAATQIEISADNVTWESIDSTKYGGNIDDANNRSYVHTLNASATYYIRSKNATTSWYYQTVETEEGGLDQMELSMVLGIGIVALLFLLIAFYLDDNHFLLKLMLIFFALISIIQIPSAIINQSSAGSQTTFLKTTTWFFRLFVTYIMIYIFYHWAKKSEKLSRTMERIKNTFHK